MQPVTHIGFPWRLISLLVYDIQRFPKEHHRDAREGEVKADLLHDALTLEHVLRTAGRHVSLIFVEHHHIDECDQDRWCATWFSLLICK